MTQNESEIEDKLMQAIANVNETEAQSALQELDTGRPQYLLDGVGAQEAEINIAVQAADEVERKLDLIESVEQTLSARKAELRAQLDEIHARRDAAEFAYALMSSKQRRPK